MKKEKPEPRNLFELRPFRLIEWEKDPFDRVTLLVPKFRKGFLSRWLQPRLSRPVFRVQLDEFGSFVWLHCDGLKNVRGMGEQMKTRFGEAAEPIYDRIGLFLQQLENSQFIGFDAGGSETAENEAVQMGSSPLSPP